MDSPREKNIVFSSFGDVNAFNEQLPCEFESKLIKSNVLKCENELTVTSALIGYTLKETWSTDYDIVPEIENPESENVSMDAVGNDLEESVMNGLIEYHVMESLSGNCGILDVELRKTFDEKVSNNKTFLQISFDPTSDFDKKLCENRDEDSSYVAASGMCSVQRIDTASPIKTQQVAQMCLDYAQECHQPFHEIGVWTESLYSGNLLGSQIQSNLDCEDVRGKYKIDNYASSSDPVRELVMDENICQSDHVSWLDSEWEMERSLYEEWGGVLAAIVQSPRSSLLQSTPFSSDMVTCPKPHIISTPSQDQHFFIPKSNPITTETISEHEISSEEAELWKDSTDFHHTQRKGWGEWLTEIQTQTDTAWTPESVRVWNTPLARTMLAKVREDQVVPQTVYSREFLRQDHVSELSHSVPLRLNHGSESSYSGPHRQDHEWESSHSVLLRQDHGSKSSHTVPHRLDHGSESSHWVPHRQDHGLESSYSGLLRQDHEWESSHSVALRQDHGSELSRSLGLSDDRGPTSVDTNMPVNRKPRGLKRNSTLAASKLAKSGRKGSDISSTYRPKLLLAFTTDSRKYQIDLTLGRPVRFKTEEEKEKWDLGVEVNARRLREEVESGEVVPEEVESDEMVDRVQLEHQLHRRELIASRALHYDPLLPSTLRRLAIERALLDLDRTVKQYLLTDPQVVLLRLETVLRLPITAPSLLRVPHLLATLTKATKLCGVKNATIMEKISAILKIVNEKQGDVDGLLPREWKPSAPLAEVSLSLFLSIFDSCTTEGNKEGPQIVPDILTPELEWNSQER